MKWMKWSGVAAALILLWACFEAWAYIPSRDFTVTGVDAGPVLHKPAYTHFVFTFVYIVFSLLPKIWAKRSNLLVASLNIAWAIRNYVVVSACSGGECPEKKVALFILVFASLWMLIASLFPDIRIKPTTTGTQQ